MTISVVFGSRLVIYSKAWRSTISSTTTSVTTYIRSSFSFSTSIGIRTCIKNWWFFPFKSASPSFRVHLKVCRYDFLVCNYIIAHFNVSHMKTLRDEVFKVIEFLIGLKVSL